MADHLKPSEWREDFKQKYKGGGGLALSRIENTHGHNEMKLQFSPWPADGGILLLRP